MDLLRNYQLQKELSHATLSYDQEALHQRILHAYKLQFPPVPDTPLQYSASAVNSPRAKQRTPAASLVIVPAQLSETSSEFGAQLPDSVRLLEARILRLEEEIESMRKESAQAVDDLVKVKTKLSDVSLERDQLLSNVKSLKSVISSETTPTRVLERLNGDGANTELKLEIYRKQIASLTAELARLK